MVKISAAQMHVSHTSLEANVSKICGYMEKAGSGIICFPELSLSGFYRPGLKELEDSLGLICKTAADTGIWAIVGAYATRGEHIFNELYLIDDKGQLTYTYQKKHPWIEEDEITPGTENKAVNTEFGIIGMLNCYDLSFPWEAEHLAKGGAKIIFCPSYWYREYPNYRRYPEKTAARNNILLVLCDAFSNETIGRSKIVSPRGLVAEAKGEQMISAYRKV
jgi:predicted amidohydrolase